MTNGRDAFKAVVEEWIRAANERDVDACNRLRAPEYKLLLSNGKRVTRAVVEDMMKGGDAPVARRLAEQYDVAA